MTDKINSLIKNIKKLDGAEIDTANAGVIFNNTEKLSKTPEEAINQGRADSIKQGRPFEEPNGSPSDKDMQDTVERYVSDVLEKLL